MLTNAFLQEPELRSAAFRYGFLAALLVLIPFAATAAAGLAPTARGRYFGFIIPPMLLLNHLAFQFQWSPSVKVTLRIGAVLGCGVSLSYALFVALTN